MDGTAAINNNLEALKRILAGLVAMAGIGSHAEVRAEDEPRRTLPRHLRLAILRLLRPAEAAARRLIIASARGLVVPLPPPRKHKPKPATAEPLLRRFGIAVVMSPADLASASILPRLRGRGTAEGGGGGGVEPQPSAPRALTLPLLDPPQRPFRRCRRHAPAHATPRIRFPGVTRAIPGNVETGFPSGIAARTTPFSLPPLLSPDDAIDATRLGLRLAALAAALDDLPGQARRFARWKARGADAAGAQNKDLDARRKGHAAGRFRRISPLRSGRPPGGRLSRFDPSAKLSRNIREVDEILAHAHALALYALRSPDTS
jgi:hypothetical protein